MLRTLICLHLMLNLHRRFCNCRALQIDDTRAIQVILFVACFGVQDSVSIVGSFLQLGGPLLDPIKDLLDILVSTKVEYRHGFLHNQQRCRCFGLKRLREVDITTIF